VGVTFLEYLDRIGQRRALNPRQPRDIRQLIGFGFLVGYYVMVWLFATRDVPEANVGLIRDAMLTLGPPVGLIVGAMFRSDAREDQSARNTSEAFKTVREVAASAPKGTQADPVVTKEADS
jgi:hypothetical protein